MRRKPKKRFIDVANNPKYAKANLALSKLGTSRPNANKQIENPITGSFDWGLFPAIKKSQAIFEAGPIRLRYGEHLGPNRGYGLEHIWFAHFQNPNDEQDSPILALPKIADLLSEILHSGSDILYEYALGSGANRTTIFKNTKGIAIVEAREDGRGEVFYSIVTVFPGRKGHGTVIGSL